MAVISLENVSLKRQGKLLLNNLNWQVEKGEMWAILGLNGSGKSTLLKMIMAEYFPTSGKMDVLGYRFGQGDITGVRTKIGVVGSFISERIAGNMLAEKVVLTGKYKSSILYKAYDESDLEEARQMLIALGGEHLLGRIYASLSQGEKQLLLIARSLMENPDMIILDEATTGLDLFAREKLLHQVERIADLPHAPTVLYVTHHAEEITAKMTHILLLREGAIFAKGKKEDILTPQVLADFYQSPVKLIPLDDTRFFIKPVL
ncbi:ABC transporter ATP-binding protein [Streptococcus hyointestinalis]|uniref:ABC transporter ATP-binding protein n=1 Tax=Streptococcus hyointestinalis TaxID=1337 RepID=UPI0023F54F91|nr:ABC transporter ATP-binding protein [Streptococcus hyointestinalis]MCI6871521.1 ABC transporter ATP-binding protein [Streptococcus hyointestinalis]MDD7356553.1 ABC transporter ATP-binding protein [Streptococcus hyointestinalis]MDY4553536.1 ABC transporter ATP-binding protein [Streptococcus hyointestinalis]